MKKFDPTSIPTGIATSDEKLATEIWFRKLRDDICVAFEEIEQSLEGINAKLPPGSFSIKPWSRADGGGGEISIMYGRVFEKVGVNISTVYGNFSPEFQSAIPGAEENPKFWATGISLVAHLQSPKVPAVHMNTRHISTTKRWFGGGSDLTPIIQNEEDTNTFHHALKNACDIHNFEYYPRFKAWCDDYFYIPHRNESRGVGGIFYDYLNSGDFQSDFSFTQDIGKAFLEVYPKIVISHMNEPWTSSERDYQLERRGRYAEFNLLYDRGTQFGLKTGGNTEAILMSMPPEVKWL